ncbi:MAG: DUF2169 domain-containing protein [Acidobacteria bacterium]|nr:DUF2169 domain-containing protein [Acidobacteriota bacterium]
MAHPDVDNRTPFAFAPLFLTDEEARPVVVGLVKATFDFDSAGTVRRSPQQDPVNLAGTPATDAPVPSMRFEPEAVPCKLATDVVLVGHAAPPGGGATQVDVGIKVGPVRKLARVFGTRFWVWTPQGVILTRTAALAEPVPLTWENAFGGLDVINSTPDRMLMEVRNPVGTGFGKPLRADGDRLRLPNIEDPTNLIQAYGTAVPPCGFGFTSPNWQPRAAFGGTYDEQWTATRKPLLPLDFDRRFFSAAAPGLVAPGFLRGDEDVVILNTTAGARVDFALPRVPPPLVRVVLRGGRDGVLRSALDTVVVDADRQKVVLLWRTASVPGSPHDVTALAVAAEM